jgi:hypothetical protein
MQSSLEFAISVKGCDEVSAALRQLPPDLQDKYGKRALQAAAEITVMAVRGRMPSATGLARESIGFGRVHTYRESGTLFVAIEPQKGFERIVTAEEAVGFAGSIRRRVLPRSKQSASAAFGRVQNPRKYMHLIERGRQAVHAKPGSALHSALDVENRFFTRAKGVTAHPVFGPARESVRDACRVMIEVELNRGVAEWNASQGATVA